MEYIIYKKIIRKFKRLHKYHKNQKNMNYTKKNKTYNMKLKEN